MRKNPGHMIQIKVDQWMILAQKDRITKSAPCRTYEKKHIFTSLLTK